MAIIANSRCDKEYVMSKLQEEYAYHLELLTS